jgi:hypothetical protein
MTETCSANFKENISILADTKSNILNMFSYPMFLVNIFISIPFASEERESFADDFTIKESSKSGKFFS